MSTLTDNYNLVMPDDSDVYDIERLNENFRTIDKVLRRLEKPLYFEETDSTNTTRNITISWAESWDDLIGVPLFIRSRNVGATQATYININGWGNKSLYFHHTTEYALKNSPVNYWSKSDGVYSIMWDGSKLMVLNTTVK